MAESKWEQIAFHGRGRTSGPQFYFYSQRGGRKAAQQHGYFTRLFVAVAGWQPGQRLLVYTNGGDRLGFRADAQNGLKLMRSGGTALSLAISAVSISKRVEPGHFRYVGEEDGLHIFERVEKTDG